MKDGGSGENSISSLPRTTLSPLTYYYTKKKLFISFQSSLLSHSLLPSNSLFTSHIFLSHASHHPLPLTITPSSLASLPSIFLLSHALHCSSSLFHSHIVSPPFTWQSQPTRSPTHTSFLPPSLIPFHPTSPFPHIIINISLPSNPPPPPPARIPPSPSYLSFTSPITPPSQLTLHITFNKNPN